jgi:cyclophilin family peptidyl-prolyl cis-trans isomerase
VPTEKRQRQREGRASRQAELQQAQRRRQLQRRVIAGGVIVVLVVLVVFLTNRGGGKKTKVSSASSTTVAGSTETTAAGGTAVAQGKKITGDTPCPKADMSSERTTSFEKAPPMCIDVNKTYTATMTTDVGPMTIALDAKKAPKTVNNFVVLGRYHYFDGIIFHRVIPDFVDQGGDPTGTGTGGPGYEFADELPKAGEYKAGSLAMANSGPNTNGSQFFIITGSQGVALQPNYSLFGQITDGLPIALQINKDGAADGTPKVVHRITTLTIKES